jgi:hypothetical protein
MATECYGMYRDTLVFHIWTYVRTLQKNTLDLLCGVLRLLRYLCLNPRDSGCLPKKGSHLSAVCLLAWEDA